MRDGDNSSNSAPRRRELLFSAAWVANVGLLVGMFVWVWCDGQFMRPVASYKAPHIPVTMSPLTPGRLTVSPMTAGRMRALKAVGGAAAVTLVGAVAGLFWGATRQRRVRSWLALTALVAGWLVVGTAWEGIGWRGQQWRLARQVAAFEAVAAPLRQKWPAEDGATDALGPFSAYPIGAPRVNAACAASVRGTVRVQYDRALGTRAHCVFS